MKYKTVQDLVAISQYSASVQAHIQVTVEVVQVVSLVIHQLIVMFHQLVRQHQFIQAMLLGTNVQVQVVYQLGFVLL